MLTAIHLVQELPDLLVGGTVTVVPVVSEGAYLLGTRAGGDGLDLARICPGKPDGTESESAAARMSDLIRGADYYIDMHTGGTLFDIFPLAGYMLHPSAKVLERQQSMARAFNLPVVWGTDMTPNGRTLSVARDAQVPAIYLESGGGAGIKKDMIQLYTQGCLNFFDMLGMTKARDVPESKIKYWVEDYTRDSGYLQGKMPAPVEGIFVPAVKLGGVVKKDQLWGTITCPLRGDTREVMADSNGIVLFLRAAPFVRAGDSLGGILSILNPGKTIIHGE
jgi:predicted deacylase